MDKMIFDANLYSAYLEGKATPEEMRVILMEMNRDPQLILTLNIAATGINPNDKI